jgi:CshA-type fibril repeat protein
MQNSPVVRHTRRQVARVVALLLAAAMAVLGLLAPALAYQVNTAAWTGGTGAGATNAVTQPSGLAVTATVGGANVTIPSTGDTMASQSPASSMFTPGIATSTPSLRVAALTGTSSSPVCPPSGTCTDRGTLTIGFSQPVADPVLHVAGIGGFSLTSDAGTVVAQSQHSSIYRLTGSTPAGATLSGPSSGSTNLAVTSTQFGAANASASSRCDTNDDDGDPVPAAATAGCGSVGVVGTVTSLTFAIDVVNTATVGPGVQDAGSGDVISLAVTTREDFGDIPASYETGNAAMAVLSDIRLGSTVTEDNADVANATVSPDAGTATGGDGVTLPPLLTSATTYTVLATLSGASKPGQLCGWVDVNRNGAFETAERACVATTAGQIAATLIFTGLSALGPTAGPTYARFRLGYNAIQVSSPVGPSDSGEVEDYPLTIALPPAPTAVNDTASTVSGQPVTIPVLSNDDGGAAGLDPSTLRLIDPVSGVPVDSVTAAGVGTWTVNDDGTVTFTPAPGFVGTATLNYQVADTQGRTTTATISVQVRAAPTLPPTTTPPVTTAPPSPTTAAPSPTATTGPAAATTTPASTTTAPTPTDTAQGSAGTVEPGPKGALATTGAAVLGVVGVGLGALLLGTVLAAVSRRRRERAEN